MTRPVLVDRTHGGAVARVVMHAPPGNIIDVAMIEALTAAIAPLGEVAGLKAILLEGSGSHFSYGVSIADHRPDRIGVMLPAFHRLFRVLGECARPIVAVVRGRCLGGGMELACFAHRAVASPEATFAQPEIGLGAFAPVASLILAQRCGQAVADDVCLTGRTYGAAEALAARLIDDVASDPRQAAEEWIAARLLPRSAAALTHATRAVRLRWNETLLAALDDLERLYLDSLMRTDDAREGIDAFLAKRPPVWRDR